MYGLTTREVLIIKAFLLSRINAYMKIAEGFSDGNGHSIGDLCVLHDLLGSAFVDFGELELSGENGELADDARDLIAANGAIANKIALAIVQKKLEDSEG